MKTDTLRVSRLEATDFCRLREVAITRQGRGLVLIKGPNTEGKTSIINALIAALSGKRHDPDRPIRGEAGAARVELTLADQLGDKLKVEVEWKAGDVTTARSLIVTDISGEHPARLSRPQSVLDKIVGAIAFDPLAFARETNATAQLRMLVDAAGVREAWDHASALQVWAAQNRTEAKAAHKAAQTALAATADPYSGEAPPDRVDSSALLERLKSEQMANQSRAAHESAVVLYEGNLAAIDQRLSELERERAEIQRKCEAARDDFCSMEIIDTTETERQIEGASEVNARIDVRERHDAAAVAAGKAVAGVVIAEDTWNERRKEARAVITGADFAGLEISVDEDGAIQVGGIPLSQCSGRERILLSTHVAAKANPTLRVICIDEADALDESGMQAVKDFAEASDVDLWMTAVWADAPEGSQTIAVSDGAATSG